MIGPHRINTACNKCIREEWDFDLCIYICRAASKWTEDWVWDALRGRNVDCGKFTTIITCREQNTGPHDCLWFKAKSWWTRFIEHWCLD